MPVIQNVLPTLTVYILLKINNPINKMIMLRCTASRFGKTLRQIVVIYITNNQG